MAKQSWLAFVILALGILIASSASIMVRYALAEGTPPLVVAALRLTFAALILTPIVLANARFELRWLEQRDLWLGVASGVLLAIHFGAWISSLALTSVASSAALVSTNPLWVGLASLLLFREQLKLAAWLGILLTLIGSLCIVISDSQSENAEAFANPTLGNVLALVGALTVSGYFLIGRELSRRLSLLVYIWLCYGAAAVTLLIGVLIAGHRLLGYSLLAYLLMLGLAVGPQLLGHTSFNWALRRLSATFVAVALLGEPIGSALLAWWLFDERFAPLQLFGFALLLVGIFIAARGEQAT